MADNTQRGDGAPGDRPSATPDEPPRHTVRGVHEQAEEEQRQLGRKVDQQVDPDRFARWRNGRPHADEMPIDTQPPADSRK